MKHTTLLFGAAVATGCSSIGSVDLAGERVELFPVAPDAPERWAAADVDGAPPEGEWLDQFNDPLLEDLVTEAIKANPGLDAQIATVRAARFDLQAQRGNRFPFISASGSAGARRSVFEGPGGDAVESDAASYGLGLNASWEADLFGRVATGIDLAEAQLALSRSDLAAAELSLAAQTAIGWTNLNAALAQQQVAEATVEARERIADLTERRFARGLSTALDVRTARSALAGAQANLAARRQATGETARSLEILLGRYPAAELEAPAHLPELDPIRPAGNPVMLLARRPDIASAEAQVVAAGLRAEQARLALRPSLNITAGLSTDGETIGRAFDPAFIAGQALASLTRPLYSGGQLSAQRDAALARARGAIANYASQALTAWREVEDAIAADVYLADQEAAQLRALEEAAFAEDIAERQYRNGLVSIFNLIDAQTRRLNAESNLVTARAQRATNRVRYHLALGGGLPSDTPSRDPENAGAAGGSDPQ